MVSSKDKDLRVTHSHRSNPHVCVDLCRRVCTLGAREHRGDPDGLWCVQGFGGGAHSELEQGAGGQPKEAAAVGGSSQSRVDPRVRCDNGPKGNEVPDRVTGFGKKVAFIKGNFRA